MPSKLRDQTVRTTVELDLCLSCGICKAVCPVNAIEMTFRNGQFVPNINHSNCTQCGICLQLCPGFDIFPEPFREKQIEQIISNQPVIKAYTVHSNDDQMRFEGTSGGFITHLLCLLLEDKKFDAAFVLPFNTFDGSEAMLEPISDSKTIRSAAGSKYVPASVEKVISTLRNNKSSRYIIVGTSCHIDGILSVVRHYNLPRENLFFCGILCHRTFNYNAIRLYEDMFRKNKHERLTSIHFRSKEQLGWPGGTKLRFSSGIEKIVSQEIRKECKKYFQLNRCLFCFNKFNRQADISCGDCYVPEEKSQCGSSNIIIRTEKGLKIFQRYKKNFTCSPADMECIEKSQDFFQETIEHIEHAAILAKNFSIPVATKITPNRLSSARKRLSREQSLMRLGQRYAYRSIRLRMIMDKFINKESIRWHLDTLTFALVYLTGMLARKKRPISSGRKNVIIVGGELFNKGAQAMTFAVIDYIKSRFPGTSCYLFSAIDYERTEQDKEKYAFKIMPWNFSSKLRIANKLNRVFIRNNRYCDMEIEIKSILVNACCMIDISGFGLSSQFGDFKSFNYLLNCIVAARYKIPMYLMPQSFGPFDYSRSRKGMLMALLSKWLRYPKTIFYREDDAMEHMKIFRDITPKKSPDMVLLSPKLTLENIYTTIPTSSLPVHIDASVGIVPNKMLETIIERPALIKLYEAIIENIFSLGKHVVIVQHAADDRWLCHTISQRFESHPNVSSVIGDVPSFELENVIGSFDWIVGSRYHSIIHAYKHGVPALVMGWAEKYAELLQTFGQTDYCFNCRSDISQKKILAKIDLMEKSYKKASHTIKTVYKNLQDTSNPLDNIIIS